MKPGGQTLPQVPQLDRFDCTSTQAPPQIWSGALQPAAGESRGTSTVGASELPDGPASLKGT
jgi:hypothetical protein